MGKRIERTKTSEIPKTEPKDRRPQLMKDLGVERWANDPVDVLAFQTLPFFDARTRIYNLIRLRSWGTMVTRPGESERTPSLYAVRLEKSRITKTVYARPLRAVDISEELRIDKWTVSKVLSFLEARKAIRTDGKKIFPTANPDLEQHQKLVDSPTFFMQDPIYQRLEKLDLELATKYREALARASQPVIAEYQPLLKDVKSKKNRRKRELKKTSSSAENVEVGESANFFERSSTDSTPRNTKTAPQEPNEPNTEVGESANFFPLSPIKQVGEFANQKLTQPAQNEADKPRPKSLKTLKKKSVGRSIERDQPTDRQEYASLKQTIIESGICEKLADTPTKELYAEIAQALNGAPLSDLKKRIELKFDKITGLGMLRGLASDVARAHKASRVPQSNSQPTAKPAAIATEARRAALEILNDPNESAESKQLAREVLEEQPA